MKQSSIAFLGSGNMARSLIGGLIADGWDPRSIWATDPDEGKRDDMRRSFGINTEADNARAIAVADVVVLAIKPQVMKAVAKEIAQAVQHRQPLIISIAAGIRATDLQRWLGGDIPLVRVMPNTPALVQTGAAALYANDLVSSAQRSLAESIMRSVGLALWVDEEAQMDAVTALSGSGPAYFFLVMEALEHAGRQLGLPMETARLLTLQTALGAAKMALESSEDCAELRRRVTSPGGTTERAIRVLQDGHLQDLFDAALQAANARSVELAQLFGES